MARDPVFELVGDGGRGHHDQDGYVENRPDDAQGNHHPSQILEAVVVEGSSDKEACHYQHGGEGDVAANDGELDDCDHGNILSRGY